jgi:cysteine desulfurase/selenocysteine lyase
MCVTRRVAAVTRREFGHLVSTAVVASRTLAGKEPRGSTPDDWRADFPALGQSVNGHPLTYLDSAATTLRPAVVIDAVSRFYSGDNANPGAALHTLARRAHEQYENARRIVANFIHAADLNEIVWVRGTTEAINLVAAAWGLANLRTGDDVILTVAEHYSNLLPWRIAAERSGAKTLFVDVDDDGRVRLDDLDRKLSRRTKLVAVSHVSNVVGYVNPVAEICAWARRVGARVLVDAAQSVPHIPVDVQALGCDFLAFSSHKMAGPMGVGVLWARRELLDAMPPYQSGSNMAHDVDLESARYEHAALKFGAGTPNVSGPIGLAAAVDYLTRAGRDVIQRHERSLTEYALARFNGIRGLRLLGPTTPENRVPVFSFSLAGWKPADLVRELDRRGIAIRAGDLAALPLLKRLGVTSAARASCSLYTTKNEIDQLAAALERLSADAPAQAAR